MTLTVLAWICAPLGALLSCSLMIAEYLGMETPAWCPIKNRMWGRFVLMHLASIVWLLFTDM